MFWQKKNKNKIVRTVSANREKSLRSYRENRLKNSGSSSNRGHFNWRRVFYGLIFLVFVSTIIYILFFSEFLLVMQIQINGTAAVNEQALKERVEQNMQRKYLNFLKKENLILIDKTKIANDLLDNFKRIKSVEISKKFPNTLVVSVQERDAMLIICAQNCFVIDEQGVPYMPADPQLDFIQANKFVTLVDDSNREIRIGEEVANPNFVQFALEAKKRLAEEANLETEDELHTPRIISGDVKLKTKEGWEIFLNQEIGMDKELEMLKVVLADKIDKNRKSDLEYIDLRLDNKVYYKYKN